MNSYYDKSIDDNMSKIVTLTILEEGLRKDRKIREDRVVERRPNGILIELVADRGKKGKEYLVHCEGYAKIAKEKDLEFMVGYLENRAAHYVLAKIEWEGGQ